MGTNRQASSAVYDVVASYNEKIAMRDGVKLGVDLYFPATNGEVAPGKFPVLLERTPYDKTDSDLVATARFFARHGYVTAIQDVRGRFSSEGEWYPFAEEAEDGYDTVQWLGSQSWSSGKVGTFGLSYAGSVQHALASLNPSHLGAMVPVEATSSYHTTAMRQGGAAELRFLPYAFWMASESPEALANPGLRDAVLKELEEMPELLKRLPFKRGTTTLRHFPKVEQWIYDVITHGEYDDYWKQRGYSAQEYYDEHADVPMYILSGWYDTYPRAATDNYMALSKKKKSLVKLIIGPWLHDILPLRDTFAGDVDFGIESPLDYDGLRLRFFDETLKGLHTGLAQEDPVLIFVMGGGSGKKLLSGKIDHGGHWRSEPDWPIARTVNREYYLNSEGHLVLDQEDFGEKESTTYLFDPKDPVPTVGGSISAVDFILPPGGYDQRGTPGLWGHKDTLPLNTRQDVLTFQTDPLEEAVEVTGSVVARLYVSSSAIDTDFTVKLLDIYPPSEDYPDGYALNIQDSIIRARYRHGSVGEHFLEPGEVVPVEVVLHPTSNVFAPGHRIRVDISSSNYPRFDVNSNTGAPLGTPGKAIVAENTIYHSEEYPSCIQVPTIP